MSWFQNERKKINLILHQFPLNPDKWRPSLSGLTSAIAQTSQNSQSPQTCNPTLLKIRFPETEEAKRVKRNRDQGEHSALKTAECPHLFPSCWVSYTLKTFFETNIGFLLCNCVLLWFSGLKWDSCVVLMLWMVPQTASSRCKGGQKLTLGGQNELKGCLFPL